MIQPGGRAPAAGGAELRGPAAPRTGETVSSFTVTIDYYYSYH